ncbi:MAG: helix-turn-helix domain-containing protein, partial [Streptococcaceae bacterium]|nr:helix-turn-helix domain-containing protein [Streptococcaceae bacterium]
MIHYRKILELHLNGISQRTICTSLGTSHTTTSETIRRFNAQGLTSLSKSMSDRWLEEFLFPEKQAIEKGYFPPDLEWIHKELQKKNVTLKLLH